MEIAWDLLAFSFGGGVAAVFNPCGFAMLPAYIAAYLGQRSQGEDASEPSLRRIGSGLNLGLVVSAGFITIFALLGVLFGLIGANIDRDTIHIVGALVGIALVVLGVLMLTGSALSVSALERLADRVTALGRDSEGASQGMRFYYFYGIAYAIASIGCTFPIFLMIVNNAFRGGFANGIVQFGAYAAGMSVIMLGVSILMVVAKDVIQRVMPVLMRGVQYVGGAIVIIAGGYVVWYNVFYGQLIAF